MDAELAREIREFRSPTDGETRMFYEIVIAPGYTPEGLEVLKGKSKTLRILEAAPRAPVGRSLRQVAGGWLMQEADTLVPEGIEFTCVSEVKPTAEQLADIKFAWLCVKHVKSNAITVAKGRKLLGMGSGQPNRVKSVQIALEKAAEEVKVRVPRPPAWPGHRQKPEVWSLGKAPTPPLCFLPFSPLRRARCWHRTRSSPSPGTTLLRLRARRGSPPSSTPAAACATRTPSSAATSTAWRCWSPASGTLNTSASSSPLFPP